MDLRRWQKEALPLIFDAATKRENGVVGAATGSGKSLLIGIVAAKLPRRPHERTVITAPTKTIIHQLKRLFHSFGVGAGSFFSDGKDLSWPVIIACRGSLEALQHELRKRKLHVVHWIADECHGTEATTLQSWAEEWPDAWRLGFTATPHRTSEEERLRLYDRLIYRYTAEQALADGVIVEPRILRYEGRETIGDDICVDFCRDHRLRDLPGLVSAWDIDDAEAFAGKLSLTGIPALAIHGRHSDDEQARRIKLLRRGKIRCLVHVNLLTEGADLPWLRWLLLRRFAKNNKTSRNRFIQEAGRTLRTCAEAPDKKAALLLDPFDQCSRLKLTYQEMLGEVGEESS